MFLLMHIRLSNTTWSLMCKCERRRVWNYLICYIKNWSSDFSFICNLTSITAHQISLLPKIWTADSKWFGFCRPVSTARFLKIWNLTTTFGRRLPLYRQSDVKIRTEIQTISIVNNSNRSGTRTQATTLFSLSGHLLHTVAIMLLEEEYVWKCTSTVYW